MLGICFADISLLAIFLTPICTQKFCLSRLVCAHTWLNFTGSMYVVSSIRLSNLSDLTSNSLITPSFLSVYSCGLASVIGSLFPSHDTCASFFYCFPFVAFVD